MSEKEIIEGCITGDRHAQKMLFMKSKDRLYTVTYRIVKDAHLAHDVLQETYMDIYKDIKNFKANSSLLTWMTTIAVRKAIRHVKLKYDFVDLNELTPQQQLSVESDTFSAEDLQKSIDCLPSGYRVVFTLIEVEGYSHKEVADILDISEGTSKSQLFHAKKALRKMLQADYSYGKV